MSFSNQHTSDKVYYDLLISNISSQESVPPNLVFNETRNNPLVLNPESYYLSIVRFTLDTTTLPIIQPVIQPNQNLINKTLYSFTLTWKNPIAPFTEYNQQEFLMYEPQNKGASIPTPPSQNENKLQNNATGYYDIYSAQYFIYLVNKTFITAFNGLQAQVAANALPTTFAPVMTWATEGDFGIINADQNGYDDSRTDPVLYPKGYIEIWMNGNMYNLFSSFPVFIEGLSPLSVGKNVRVATNSLGGSNIIQFPPNLPSLPNPPPAVYNPADYSYPALQIIQEFSTLSVWTPITSIVFVSNTLPIAPNQVSAPLLYYNGKQYVAGGNNSNFAQIITDFTADDGIYKPSIKYIPTAQYRLISLLGNTPIYTIDIEVLYKNRIGELVPFKLSSGGSATVKFLFTRKGTEGDLYN